MISSAKSNILPIHVHQQTAVSPEKKHFETSHCIIKKDFLTGEELNAAELQALLNKALILKSERTPQTLRTELTGYHLALLFDKPSLRTRFSFALAMRELGGDVIESIELTRKSEWPEDLARVLGGYCHAMMVRTHQHQHLERMSKSGRIPIINGLSDLYHPCQILADLLTLLEKFQSLQGLTVAYVGDGNNVLHSLLLMAPLLGINVHYCCPPARLPDDRVLTRCFANLNLSTGFIRACVNPQAAVRGADAVYTDVWTSMGFEDQEADHLFQGYEVNEALMQHANPHAVFMHCLPMVRGKEVSATLPDHPCSVIFQQSENRLHVQKALLLYLLKGML